MGSVRRHSAMWRCLEPAPAQARLLPAICAVFQALNEFSDGSSAPGVFFVYEFAPLMVKYTEKIK